MKWYLDRIEGDRAILQKESGEMTAVASSALPEGVREGGVLICADGVFLPAPEAEAERRKKLFAKQRRLPRKRKEQKGE